MDTKLKIRTMTTTSQLLDSNPKCHLRTKHVDAMKFCKEKNKEQVLNNNFWGLGNKCRYLIKPLWKILITKISIIHGN